MGPRTSVSAEAYARVSQNNKEEYWGKERYDKATGVWPGLDGEPPLVVEAETLSLNFHCDLKTDKFRVKVAYVHA